MLRKLGIYIGKKIDWITNSSYNKTVFQGITNLNVKDQRTSFGFGCPGSPALMLMGGGARIYFCVLCPLGGISGRNTSDSDGCELSGTAQAPGCLVPVLETCSSEGEGKGFPLLVLEYHRESRDCFSFDLSVDVA